ncbi:MAG: tandem-95 repeat protein, partial [Planctomycetota bacterium]
MLATDYDVDGDVLTATLVTAPSNGTLLSFNADGSFVYAPHFGCTCGDTFTYRLSDGVTPTPTTHTVTISTGNTAPKPVSDSVTVQEDSNSNPIAGFNVLSNDTDDESDTLFVVSATTPANSSSFSISTTGAVAFRPAANFFGVTTSVYTVSDGNLTQTATLTLNVSAVNDAPTVTAKAFTTSFNTARTVTVADLLVGSNDVDGPTSPARTAIRVSGPGLGPNNGTLSVNVSNGSITYTPNVGFSGTDFFTFRARDGAGAESGNGTATITVNQPPTVTNKSYSTPVNTTLNVAAAGLLVGAADVDGPASPAMRAVRVGLPSKGTVTVQDNGSFTYVPNLNASGSDSFTFRAIDGGGAQSGLATATIMIGSNSAPTTSNASFVTPEDTNGNWSVPGSDANSDPLQITSITQPPSGTGSVAAISGLQFRYTPPANWFGTTTFTFRLSDGTTQSAIATATVTVTPVNDAPVANPDSATTNKNTAVTIPLSTLLSNDNPGPLESSQTRTVTEVLGATNGTVAISGSNAIFTPSANFAGTASFTYTMRDNGQTGSPLVNDFKSATGTVTLLVYDSVPTKFYTVNSTGTSVFRSGPTGTPIAPFSSSITSPTQNHIGIAANAANTHVWVLGTTGKVNVHSNTSALLGSWVAQTTTGAALANPQDIATFGNDIWIVDAQTDALYVYSDAALTSNSATPVRASRSFTLSADNRYATGLAMRGTRLWVTDRPPTGSARVFVYESNGVCVGSWTLATANADPTGITLNPVSGQADSNDLWVIDKVDRLVYRYNNMVGALSGTGTVSSSWALNPNNNSPEGIADPPPPNWTPSIRWTGSAGGSWNNSANWTPNRLPTATDNVLIDIPNGEFVIDVPSATTVSVNTLYTTERVRLLTGGSLSLAGPSEIERLSVEGGTLTGAGTVTITNSLNWTSGTMAGTGTTLIASGAT